MDADVFSIIALALGVAAIVMSALTMRAALPLIRKNRLLKTLLREAATDRSMLTHQLRIVRGERDDYLAKYKRLLMPGSSK